MKINFFLISIVLFSSVFAQTEKIDNSITIHNLIHTEQQLWVNAVSYNIPSNLSLRVPCNVGEDIEVQYLDELVILACGSEKELKSR